MKWENEPTGDGFYWAKLNGFDFEITIVKVRDYDQKNEKYGCMVSYIGTDWDSDINENNCNGEWYGPISPPKEEVK